jgi:hypothetical protein
MNYVTKVEPHYPITILFSINEVYCGVKLTLCIYQGESGGQIQIL